LCKALKEKFGNCNDRLQTAVKTAIEAMPGEKKRWQVFASAHAKVGCRLFACE
jgi:hypothetical protein